MADDRDRSDLPGNCYYLALTVENPLTSLLVFFVAVVLVIIGTYLLLPQAALHFETSEKE